MLHHFHLDRLTAHGMLNKRAFKSLIPSCHPFPGSAGGHKCRQALGKGIAAQSTGTVEPRGRRVDTTARPAAEALLWEWRPAVCVRWELGCACENNRHAKSAQAGASVEVPHV